MKATNLIKFPLVVLVGAALLYLVVAGGKNEWGKLGKREGPPLSAQKGRFQHLDGMPIDLAFDDWTGQMCKTWNWDEKVRPEIKVYASLPLCASLPRSAPEGKSGKE